MGPEGSQVPDVSFWKNQIQMPPVEIDKTHIVGQRWGVIRSQNMLPSGLEIKKLILNQTDFSESGLQQKSWILSEFRDFGREFWCTNVWKKVGNRPQNLSELFQTNLKNLWKMPFELRLQHRIKPEPKINPSGYPLEHWFSLKREIFEKKPSGDPLEHLFKVLPEAL